ncbi:VanZ family protein [Cupriavidus sp. YR651]|uniref:VanZ family protein n=1 Tax=Cupriavidus sp. YR651 TaxID=1855315 RepID=UPI0021007886|nr:VanZ family protein [Cupriavidus sp. YR651]
MDPSNLPEPTGVPILTISRFRLLFWLCALVVMVLSLLPPSTPLPTTGWDKTNHLLAFSVLAVLGLRAWPTRRWRVLVGLVVYGALIEVLQGMSGDREPSWLDLLADTIGIALGLGVEAALARIWPRPLPAAGPAAGNPAEKSSGKPAGKAAGNQGAGGN